MSPNDQFLEVNAGGHGWMTNLGDIYGDFTDLTFLSLPGKGAMGSIWNRNLRGRLMGSWSDYGDIQSVNGAASVGAQIQDRYILTLTSIYQEQAAQTLAADSIARDRLLLSILGTWRPYSWLGVSGEFVQSFAGQQGGRIWAARTKDGAKIASRDLPAPPVWDGLAVARGNCVVASKDGTVLCLR